MIFNTPPTRRAIPHAYGTDKAILGILSELPEGADYNLPEIISEAYCLSQPEKLVKAQLPNLIRRVEERIINLQAQVSAKKKPNYSVKTLGSSFSEWIASMSAEEACLYLADHDPEKAYHYYWLTDMEWVEAALKQKIAKASQDLIAMMEASMYGSGGKYANDDGQANHFDLNSGEGLDVLKQFGF